MLYYWENQKRYLLFNEGRSLHASVMILWWVLLCLLLVTVIMCSSLWVSEYGALVEWYWQQKTEVLLRKTSPGATLSTINRTWNGLGLNQVLCGDGQQLTAGAMAQLKCNVVVAVQGKHKPLLQVYVCGYRTSKWNCIYFGILIVTSRFTFFFCMKESQVYGFRSSGMCCFVTGWVVSCILKVPGVFVVQVQAVQDEDVITAVLQNCGNHLPSNIKL
jgi:hypothetical protein